jgi:hypothetical protein
MLVAIALVHVDVMDAVAGTETEYVVRRTQFRSPTRSVGVEPASGVGSRTLDVIIELVDEIVAGTGTAGWDAPHVAAVEHAASLIVQRQLARARVDAEIAVADFHQPPGDIVLEVIVGEVE